jgi:hypothetical protein
MSLRSRAEAGIHAPTMTETTMSDLQRTIEADPYKVVVNLEKTFRPAKPDEVVSYKASAIITRLDGNPVYKTFRVYVIEQGEVSQCL